jgi:tetratricopeptide (TPR) repeat protein
MPSRFVVALVLSTVLLSRGAARAQEGTPEAQGEPAPNSAEPLAPAAGPADEPAPGAAAPDLHPAYQELVKAGVDAQAEGDYARAHEAFAQAHGLYPNARALRAMGVASFKAGAFVRALAELSAALEEREKPLDDRLRAGAEDLLLRAQREVSVVVLSVTPKGGEVLVDGQASPHATGRPLVLEPGSHRLRISAQGHVSQELGIQGVAGARQSLSVALVPVGVAPQALPAPALSAPPEPDPQVLRAQRAHRRRVLGLWVAGGLGVASGVTSAALYGVARQRIDAIDKACRKSEAGGCTDEEKSVEAQEAKLPTLERSINATMAVAFAGALASIALVSFDYFANGRRIELHVSHETLGVRGTF